MSEVMHMLRQIGLQVKDLIRTVLTDWILCFLTFSFNKHLGGGLWWPNSACGQLLCPSVHRLRGLFVGQVVILAAPCRVFSSRHT